VWQGKSQLYLDSDVNRYEHSPMLLLQECTIRYKRQNTHPASQNDSTAMPALGVCGKLMECLCVARKVTTLLRLRCK